MYLPLHNSSVRTYIVRIPAKLCFFTVSVPLFAFMTCVIITIYKDFEHANRTHCNVANIFPSISASIGNYEPQITIWKSAIYMHSPLRFYILYLRWMYYLKVIQESNTILINIAVILNIIENLTLLGLTHWTSSENYPNHEKCFKMFISSSILYMFLICIMLTKYRRRPIVTQRERRSIKLKWRAFIVNVTSFAIAAYCFLRHNSACEPYVYSVFAFAEYIVVISNIVFHLTTAYDLQFSYIFISKKGLSID